MERGHLCAAVLLFCVGLLPAMPAASQEVEAVGFERTPPRLGFTEGQVSFLRAGAPDWTPAYVNTPLAPGDELYAGAGSNLEIQVGARAYVRAGEDTQLGLVSLEPDYLQLRVTSGSVSLDLRSLAASQTIEVGTPNAAFTIERTGYYRVEVAGEATSFTTRRGGRAMVTPAAGVSFTLEPSEQVVVTGTDPSTLESYAAPELDGWDRWNYARTDDLLDAVSARYVSPGVYGVADLDHHGDWRLVPTYGAVWVPRALPVGWVPYSAGRWVYDPFYYWTWVDDMSWGWAPYHYGRWVYTSSYWAWCPGPIVVRPYYAPALVAFFGGGGFSIGITLGTPYLGWVALGWGEPLVPWWGPVGFRGHPHWARWGGPRVVNRVVIERTRVIHAPDIHAYEHARERERIVTVERERFGHRTAERERFARGDVARLEPVRGELPVKPDRTSLVPGRDTAPSPPREMVERRVVATRRPREAALPAFETPARGAKPAAPTPAPVRVVEPPREGSRIVAPQRPPFARQGESERKIPPPAPRYEELRRQQPQAPGGATVREPAAIPSPVGRVEPRIEPRVQPRVEPRVEPGVERRALPGEPANRVWRERSPATPRSDARGGETRQRPQERTQDGRSGSGR